MSREATDEIGPLVTSTLSIVVDQDPYTKPRGKRKLSVPTRASPRASTQQASAASFSAIPTSLSPINKRPRKRSKGDVAPDATFAGKLPSSIVYYILSHIPLTRVAQLRLVHSSWNKLILAMPLPVLSLLDVARKIDDKSLTQIALFAGSRPQVIDISHCSHLTDSAFNTLTAYCAASLSSLSLASCWNISPSALIDLAVKAPNLKSLNLSNCRKLNDQALFKIINTAYKLEELDIGYCKHISDRSMHCIALHASPRLKVLKMARCTSITDAGFGYWSYAPTGFPRMTTLVLRDCTFLSDNSIVALTNSCTALEHLNLSFCCALSDTSVEVLSLGLRNLKSLDLAFCGSAVSDSSLQSIGHHLQGLRSLSVRGCVRVTQSGVNSILAGVTTLRVLDVTQCRNLRGLPAKPGCEIIMGG